MSKFVFRNYGGSYQLRIQDADDLREIHELNDAHWTATSIPIDCLSCDPVFAADVDTDRNARIRTQELRDAVQWMFHMLSGRDRVTEGSDVLRLADIDTTHDEGKKLHASATLILTNLNCSDADAISLAQVRDIKSILGQAANNGDGIICPESVSEPDTSEFVLSVMNTIGSVLDASGKPGIGEKELVEFFSEAEAYLAWSARGKMPPGQNTTDIMVWGNDTPQAFEAMACLEEKIEEYFGQCRMVRLDERTGARIELSEKELQETDFRDVQAMELCLKNAPLAVPDGRLILDFEQKVNPAYAREMLAFRNKVFGRAIGQDITQLSYQEWQEVKDILAPYKSWIQEKRGKRVEKVGPEKLRGYIDGQYRQRLGELISKDKEVAEELAQIHNLEKLILYQRWLLEMANNFVSFPYLYDPLRQSLFEAGTLIIDGREITFTMKVKDRPAHKKVAQESCMYLLYVEVTGRQDKEVKYEVVAPVTSGSTGRLRIGKRGVFFDTHGRQWDAEVVDIVSNPIGMLESLKAPFSRLIDFAKKQIEKFSQVRQQKLESALAAPTASGAARDLLLGGSFAIAALGASFGYVTKALAAVEPYHVLYTLTGIAALLIVPGVVMGYLRIRKRDVSVLLEASGWAVNLNMRLHTALGRLFTHVPALPEGSRRQRADVVAGVVSEFGFMNVRSKKPMVVLAILAVLLIVIAAFYTYPAIRGR